MTDQPSARTSSKARAKTIRNGHSGKTRVYSAAVRKLAAKTAVAASKKSGRKVDPRVAKLADS